MDQKSLIWKRRSTEKTLATDRKANHSFISNKEEEGEENEVHELGTEKSKVERDVRVLKDKLQAALSECSSRYNISKEQVKIAQEAIADIDKSETQALSLKNDLDKALQQKSACEERLVYLDTALKECTQQLHFVRNEQEKRVHSAVMKTSRESDKTKIALEERLAEATTKIARLDEENKQFKKSLLKKDTVVEELSRYRSHVEADMKALILRLESTEKENASLKYEVCVLERELEIRHEEIEFNRRTADATQKQHKASVEKIAKLESECQMLRSLIRKRLPGPAALVRMKNEVKGPGKDQSETRRGKSTHAAEMLGFLNEQLQKMEEENKILKHALNEKSGRGEYPATLSDMGSDGKSESWGSGLISELEHFKNEIRSGTQSVRYMGTPDMNLMDDFAEMEKLAYSPHKSENKAFNLEAYETGNRNNSSATTKGDQKFQCNVSIPIKKIIELLEGMNVKITQDSDTAECIPGKDDKIIRVFQCETAEFSDIVQQCVETCNDLLTGKGDLEQFAISMASNLEWIVNHSAEFDKQSILIEEANKGLNFKPANKESSVVVNLEGTLQSQIDKVESFRIQHKDSKDITENLELEMQPEDNIRDQTEEQKRIFETNLERSKTFEEISHPENDMEKNEKSCENSDEPHNEVKTHLEGEASNEGPNDENQHQSDQEITSASEKLAECQETLRNLGKQLKALASPRDAATFDKVVSTSVDPVITSMSTPQRNGSQRLSLLDKMLAEDNVQIAASPRTKGATHDGQDNSDVTSNATIEPWSKYTDPEQIGGDADSKAVVSMAIVPRKKKDSRNFMKKLIWWQKKGNSKKRSSHELQ